MANTKVTKAVLADDAVGLAQLDITNDPSDGQALTASNDGSNNYTLAWANNTVAGISSSADATAITINSSEQVGIGTSSFPSWSGDLLKIGSKSLYGQLDINGAAYLVSNVAYDGSNWKYVTSDTGSIYSQDPSASNSHLWYTIADGTAGATATLNERMRLTNNGQLAVGNTGFGTGVIAYDRDVGAPYWGMNVTENSTYNDNSGHSFTSKHNTHGVIYIKDEGGNTGYAALPFYPNGGGGVAYEWNILDPDNGTWVRGNVGFGLGGSSNLDFTVAFATGSGTITVTRTAGSALYRVVIMEFAQQ